MSNLDIADELDQQLPPSRNLHESLSRAEELAARRKHSVVGLDHLLLALGQDPDAVGIMLLCELNVESLCLELLRKLGPEAKIISPNALPPSLDISVQNLLAHASANASSAGQHEMSGANILTTIFCGESGFGAHKMLEAHGLDFQKAVSLLQGQDRQSDTTKTKTPEPLPPESPQRAGGRAEKAPKSQKPHKPQSVKQPQGKVGSGADKHPTRVKQQVKAPLTQKGRERSIPQAALETEAKGREGTPPVPQNLKQAVGEAKNQIDQRQDHANNTIIKAVADPADYDLTGEQGSDHPQPSKNEIRGQQKKEKRQQQPHPPASKFESRQEGQAPQGPRRQGQPADSRKENPVPPLNEGSGKFLRRMSMPPPPMPEAGEGGVSQRPPIIAPKSSDGPPPLVKGQMPEAALLIETAEQRSQGPAPEKQQSVPHFTPPPDQGPPPLARGSQPPHHPAARDAGNYAQEDFSKEGYPQAGYPQAGPPPQAPHPAGDMPIDDLVVEQIPRIMQVGKIHYLEVRVARFANAEIDFGPDHYGLRAKEDKGPITKAITVRLTGNDGQFLIDSFNASTQWSEIHKGVVDEADFAVWRWRVLPRKAGIANLRLDVSVRSTNEDGMSAEIPVQPSRSFTIKVRRNYLNIAKKLAIMLLIFGVGFAIAKYGQQTIETISSTIENILKQED